MDTFLPFRAYNTDNQLIIHSIIESRGLQICDRNKAIQYLDNIGYYRLSAYMRDLT